MTEQNTDFALSPDGTSTVPPQANDPRYTPSLADETADSKESDNTEGGGSGVQSQPEDNGGKTNADADDSDPNKTVKADGPVNTPGTTDADAKAAQDKADADAKAAADKADADAKKASSAKK